MPTHSHTSLLLKVCESLKSRSHDVRDAARDTLVKMAATLGPSYLPYIFKEMVDLLTRGYQVCWLYLDAFLQANA